MMSRRSTGAPVVVTCAFGTCSLAAVCSMNFAALPSTSIEEFPGSRTMVMAVRSLGKNEWRAFRIFPWLSYRRNFTHSGLVMLRSADGMAVTRASVAVESCVRAVALAVSPALVAELSAASRALPPMLSRMLPSPAVTRLFENSRADNGVMTPRMRPLFSRVPPNCWSCICPAALKSSSTLWPSFMWMTVSIAWPPKRSW